MSPSMRSALWLAFALLALALAVQVGRIGAGRAAVIAGHGDLAVRLRPHNGEALALRAAAAAHARRWEQAERDALAALRAAPLNPVALRTLGLVAERRHGPGGGDQWLRLASALGWRDRATQQWALQRAILTGDAAVAAARADAMLRIRPDEQTLTLVRMIGADPRGALAVAERLALNPSWRWRLFAATRNWGEDELAGVLGILDKLRLTRSPPSRADLRGAQYALVRHRRFDEAWQLERDHVRRQADPGSLIDDGGFGRPQSFYESGGSLFDWAIVTARGATAQLDRSIGNQSIAFTTEGAGEAMPLTRYVRLAPGSYRLSYRMSGEPDAPSALGVRLSCAVRQAPVLSSSAAPLSGGDWNSRAIDFRLPGDCPGLLIRVGGTAASGATAEALFDDFRLLPLARADAPSL